MKMLGVGGVRKGATKLLDVKASGKPHCELIRSKVHISCQGVGGSISLPDCVINRDGIIKNLFFYMKVEHALSIHM